MSNVVSCEGNEEALVKVITSQGIIRFCDRAFALEYVNAGDATRTWYQRKQKFKDEATFFSDMRNPDLLMVHLEPQEEEIGGVKVTRGPLLFDIDVTDYSNLLSCNCASTKTACSKCWSFVRLSVFVLSSMMKQSFGVPLSYQNWFFSGNRGVHGHITTANMFNYDNAQRRAIVDHLENNRAIPQPFWHEIFPTIKAFFTDVIWPEHREALDTFLRGRPRKDDEPEMQPTDADIRSICMPRIDRAVTGDARHLIRLPFTYHRRTRQLARPIPATTSNDLLAYIPPNLTAAAAAADPMQH